MSTRCCTKCQTPLNKGNKSGLCSLHRDTSLRRRYTKLRVKANIKGVSVQLSLKAYIEIMTDAACAYCDRSLEGTTGYGLDRLNPNMGYRRNNVIPCCGTCNAIKGDFLTSEETKKVVDFLKELRDTKDIWGIPRTKKKRRRVNGISKRKQ
jgi:hypothetical protein